MRVCTSCGAGIATRFRFCPWCAAPQRRKLVEFFRPHPLDRGKALRVSRYLDSPGGGHVRFSVWSDLDDGARAEAAVSLDETEAARLARFLGTPQPRPPSRLGRLMDDLRSLRTEREGTGPQAQRPARRAATRS